MWLRTAIGLIFATVTSNANAEERVALLIGNSAYETVTNLTNPRNDASDIADALEALGYEVTRQFDLSLVEMNAALRDFRRKSRSTDQAIIYFAGHGIEIDRENYLIPTDARLLSDLDVEYEAIPLDNVVRAVEGAEKFGLVILDACRDNPFANRMTRTIGSRSVGRGLAMVEPSGTTLVAYAAREGTVAADGTGRNSPYASALLETLSEPGVEVGFFFRRVRDSVLRLTGGMQEPHIYGTMSAERIYFNPPASSRTATFDERNDDRALELAFWASIKNSDIAADYEDYLEQFPDGVFSSLAGRRLSEVLAHENVSQTVEAAAPLERLEEEVVVLQSTMTPEGLIPSGTEGGDSGSPTTEQVDWPPEQDVDIAAITPNTESGTAEPFASPSSEELDAVLGERGRWRRANRDGTLEGYVAYVAENPDHPFVLEAKAKVSELARAEKESLFAAVDVMGLRDLNALLVGFAVQREVSLAVTSLSGDLSPPGNLRFLATLFRAEEDPRWVEPLQSSLSARDRVGIQMSLRALGAYSGAIDGIIGRGSLAGLDEWVGKNLGLETRTDPRVLDTLALHGAMAGSSFGQAELARAFYEGDHGLPRDPILALAWYEAALGASDFRFHPEPDEVRGATASLIVRTVRLHGPKNLALAKVLSEGSPRNCDALEALGTIYREGYGVNRDIDRAVALYEKGLTLCPGNQPLAARLRIASGLR